MTSRPIARRRRARQTDTTLIPRIVLYVGAAACLALPLVLGDLHRPVHRLPFYAAVMLITVPTWLGWRAKPGCAQ